MKCTPSSLLVVLRFDGHLVIARLISVTIVVDIFHFIFMTPEASEDSPLAHLVQATSFPTSYRKRPDIVVLSLASTELAVNRETAT